VDECGLVEPGRQGIVVATNGKRAKWRRSVTVRSSMRLMQGHRRSNRFCSNASADMLKNLDLDQVSF
jgi:hypothetical protein